MRIADNARIDNSKETVVCRSARLHESHGRAYIIRSGSGYTQATHLTHMPLHKPGPFLITLWRVSTKVSFASSQVILTNGGTAYDVLV